MMHWKPDRYVCTWSLNLEIYKLQAHQHAMKNCFDQSFAKSLITLTTAAKILQLANQKLSCLLSWYPMISSHWPDMARFMAKFEWHSSFTWSYLFWYASADIRLVWSHHGSTKLTWYSAKAYCSKKPFKVLLHLHIGVSRDIISWKGKMMYSVYF